EVARKKLRARRAVVAPAGQPPGPRPPGHGLRGRDVVAQRDQRGVEAAAAASHDHVHADAFSLEDLQEPEGGGALDAAGSEDDGHAGTVLFRRGHRPGYAGKLATAASTSGKSLRMCVKPESSSTRRTSGCTAARRKSPPCWRVSFTVSRRARRPALDV